MEIANTTIVAPATAPGGALMVIRISGPQAITIANSIWQAKTPLQAQPPGTAAVGNIVDNQEIIDQAVATIWRGPRSFTGQDTVELSLHASPWITSRVLEMLVSKGAVPAQPGEFSQRAFLNGKMDLARTEAIADLIAARSKSAHRLAMRQMRGSVSNAIETMRGQLVEMAALLELELDFSEEDVEFAPRSELHNLAERILLETNRLISTFKNASALKDGVPVAIAGAPNAGKSSLLNALLGEEKAIVTPVAGTTRDVIEDTVNIGNTTFRFLDTAGLHDTTDPVETIGIQRTHTALQNASIILLVIDAADPQDTLLPNNIRPTIILLNKIDKTLPGNITDNLFLPSDYKNIPKFPISAKTGEGIEALRIHLAELAPGYDDSSQTAITNIRHLTALREASEALSDVLAGLETHLYTDIIAQHLRRVLHSLGQITGAVTTPELLNTIFSRFCIGK